MNNTDNIALITGFKAGTVLAFNILNLITGKSVFEPKYLPGKDKYFQDKYLEFCPNHFFCWHLIPTKKVVSKLNENNAKTIFLVRNIYDIVISIYYHFYSNIDHEVGKSSNKDTFLKKFSFEEGISLIITGFDENGIRWNGMQEVIVHYNQIFKASLECDNIIIKYENLVEYKSTAIRKISSYLNIDITDNDVSLIKEKTSFNTMKKDAILNKGNASHFREGKKDFNRYQLSEYHKIQLRQMILFFANDLYDNANAIGMSDIVFE